MSKQAMGVPVLTFAPDVLPRPFSSDVRKPALRRVSAESAVMGSGRGASALATSSALMSRCTSLRLRSFSLICKWEICEIHGEISGGERMARATQNRWLK